MPAAIVFAVYGSATFLALALLYYLRATHWYLHMLSVVIALMIGLTPIPAVWRVPAIELLVGGTFLFLFLWGICAPLFPRGQGHHHHHPHRA